MKWTSWISRLAAPATLAALLSGCAVYEGSYYGEQGYGYTPYGSGPVYVAPAPSVQYYGTIHHYDVRPPRYHAPPVRYHRPPGYWRGPYYGRPDHRPPQWRGNQPNRPPQWRQPPGGNRQPNLQRLDQPFRASPGNQDNRWLSPQAPAPTGPAPGSFRTGPLRAR